MTFLTVSEVATKIRMTPMTVYRLIAAGKMKAVQIGRNYRISETTVDQFLQERETR